MARPTAHASVFRALADPTRRAVLVLLRDGGPLDAGSVLQTLRARGVRSSQSNLSRHLGVLAKSGLLTAKWSGKRHLYTFAPAAMRPIIRWVEPFRGRSGPARGAGGG